MTPAETTKQPSEFEEIITKLTRLANNLSTHAYQIQNQLNNISSYTDPQDKTGSAEGIPSPMVEPIRFVEKIDEIIENLRLSDETFCRIERHLNKINN